MRPLLPALLCLALGSALWGGSELSKAAIDGNLQKIRTLVEAGSDVNGIDKWGWTPLLWASFYRHETATRWLLGKGADPNKASTDKYRYFPPGTTPLLVAAYYGTDGIMADLLAYKADPNLADAKGTKPLALAKANEFTECLDLLEGRRKVEVPHSHANPLVAGGIAPLLVVVSSPGERYTQVLEAIETAMKEGLEARKAPCAIFRHSALALNEEQDMAAAMGKLQARHILVLSPTGVMGRAHGPMGGPATLTFQATLRGLGSPGPLWDREVSAQGVAENENWTISDGVGRHLAEAVLAEMEAGGLL